LKIENLPKGKVGISLEIKEQQNFDNMLAIVTFQEPINFQLEFSYFDESASRAVVLIFN